MDPMIDYKTRIFFSTYGMLLHPEDAGKFLEILSRAQPCTSSWEASGAKYEIKPREVATFTLVPVTAIKYSPDLQTAVETIREGGKDGEVKRSEAAANAVLLSAVKLMKGDNG